MRLTSIEVTDFLALPSLSLEVDGDLTVITGANGVGKSTILAACGLAKDAVTTAVFGDPAHLEDLERLWADAPRDAGNAFDVRVGLAFDRDDERTLFGHFYLAALLPLLQANGERADRVDELLTESLGTALADALTRGALVVRFDSLQRHRWLVGWEFELPHGAAHLGLLGPTAGELVDGPVRHDRGDSQRHVYLAPRADDTLDKVHAGDIAVKLEDIVPGKAMEFRVQRTSNRREPLSIQAVISACPEPDSRPRDGIQFARVLDVLFTRRLLVTPNRRERPQSAFRPQDLVGAPDLSDGSMLAVELHRLKNGDAAEREQFRMIQERLGLLTGQTVDCRHVTTTSSNSEPIVHLTPVLERRGEDGTTFDVPLERAGAGAVEALYLATVLAEEHHVVLLDEPAVHLSPTAQRRLLGYLRSQGHSGQVVMVTHNPDVVPVREANDLRAIVRLSRRSGEVRADRLPKDILEQPDRAIQLLASTELRNVLFAAGVVLCEGATDLAVLRSWTDQGLTTSSGESLPTSEDLNVVFYSVDGDTAFAPTIRLLRSIGIPWVVVADGPALRPGRQLARYFEQERLAVLPTAHQLDDVRDAWATAGVYTLAAEFGDDGSKSGEIEAFLQSVDREALEEAKRSVDTKKGGRVGAAFAAKVAPPTAVVGLWAEIRNHLLDTDHPVTLPAEGR